MSKSKDEVYISVDVEASGPIPGEYSMLSIGACEVANLNNGFYKELQPISERYVKKALNGYVDNRHNSGRAKYFEEMLDG